MRASPKNFAEPGGSYSARESSSDLKMSLSETNPVRTFQDGRDMLPPLAPAVAQTTYWGRPQVCKPEETVKMVNTLEILIWKISKKFCC